MMGLARMFCDLLDPVVVWSQLIRLLKSGAQNRVSAVYVVQRCTTLLGPPQPLVLFYSTYAYAR